MTPMHKLLSWAWLFLLAQQSVLDYLVAALLTQAQNLNIPPTQSLLFKDMAFEIEAVMREKK
jgi:hypothetical protein